MEFKFNIILGICLLAITATSTQAERVRYDNYRVYETTASTDTALEVLKNLEGASDSIMFLDDLLGINQSMKVVVAPHKVPDFLEILDTNEVMYQLLESNLQSQLEGEEEEVGRYNPLESESSYDWKKYYPLEDTYKWLEQLASKYPGEVNLIKGGDSYEGRSILGVKISKSKSERPGIVIEAGIHAREWISPATATYIINQLLTSQEAGVTQVAENYNWYIFPHINPDGYVYTHTENRFWRKTRKPYGSCYGADPNRNWDIEWNVVGSSKDPCSDLYAGPSAFSEIEIKSFANYLKTLEGKISLYISFHSYSQLLMYPYGYTSELPANHKDFEQVFDVAVGAISKRYNTTYTGGNIYNAIYPASGSSIDWVYENAGTKMAFCYELRPSWGYEGIGFLLPRSQIEPTGEETLDSIVAMVNEVQKLGYFS